MHPNMESRTGSANLSSRTVRRVLSTLAAGVLAATCGCTSSGTAKGPLPTPEGSEHNVVSADALLQPWAAVSSLGQWKDIADFVAVGTVTGQSVLADSATSEGEDQPTYWNSLRTATIDRVLWRHDGGAEPPKQLTFVDYGWSRDSETGEVHPNVPESGLRIDVGDTFIAAFVNRRTVQKFLDSVLEKSPESTTAGDFASDPGSSRSPADPDVQPPSEWGPLGPNARVLVVDGRITAGDHPPEFLANLVGLTVDEFAAKLTATPVERTRSP